MNSVAGAGGGAGGAAAGSGNNPLEEIVETRCS